MSRTRLPHLLLSILLVAGCSSSQRSGPQVGSEGVSRSMVIENETSIDIQVAVVVGVSVSPMGTVRARSSRTINLPRTVSNSFRLMAEPRGNASMANRIYSEPIPLSNAGEATWEIRSSGMAVVTYGNRGPLRP